MIKSTLLVLATLMPQSYVQGRPPIQGVWFACGGHQVSVQRTASHAGVLWYVPGKVYPHAIIAKAAGWELQRAGN